MCDAAPGQKSCKTCFAFGAARAFSAAFVACPAINRASATPVSPVVI